jgi:Tol biopolymer transport system component
MPNRKKRFLSADDLYKIEIPATPRISPDGSAVVYAVPRIGRKTEEKYSNLWIVPTAGGSASQYTFGDQSDSMPKWSPDGEQIAFLSNRGTGKNQVKST